MFFDHFNGYLRVVFSQADHGDLLMDLALHGDTFRMVPCYGLGETGEIKTGAAENVEIRTWFCASLCPCARFISWLEAVVCGVQECAFEWDAEGPDGELRWFDQWDSGLLQVSWIGKETVEYKVRLNKAQMVRAFYESFRGFVESDRYDPLQYEDLSARETFALVLEGGDLAAVADALVARSRRQALALIEEMLDLAADSAAGNPRRATLAQFIKRAALRHLDESRENRWLPRSGTHGMLCGAGNRTPS